MISKALKFLSLVRTNPIEAFDRAISVADAQSECRGPHAYRTCPLEDVVTFIGKHLGADPSIILDQPELHDIETRVAVRWGKLREEAPFPWFHNGDTILGRICFLVVRAFRPAITVETGVCYGVTTAFVLKALQQNRYGHLHSIDLPPLSNNGDSFVGTLVPDTLKDRWRIYRGTSRRLLPSLLHSLGPINLFIHDSLHTARNMEMEFSLAWAALAPRGVLISDDIENNEVFLRLTQLPDVAESFAVTQENKGSVLGIAFKR